MSPIRMEKVESGLRIVVAFNEALNRHDVDAMMALMSDDCLFEDTVPPDGVAYRGKKAVTKYWQDFFLRSPKAHFKIEASLGYSIHCIIRWRYDWVDTSGTPGHVRGVDIFLVQDGLIAEKLSYVKG